MIQPNEASNFINILSFFNVFQIFSSVLLTTNNRLTSKYALYWLFAVVSKFILLSPIEAYFFIISHSKLHNLSHIHGHIEKKSVF